MQRLRNSQLQIPNGFFYRQPEIKWDSKKALGLHPSLDVLTRALINARRAHPHYVAQHNWSLDFNTVRAEVESFQVKVCLANGWTQYLTDGGGGAPPPLATAPSPEEQKQLAVAASKARKLWTGVKTLNDWLDSNEPPVESGLSSKRADTCIACPHNGKGDLTSWFTTPAAAAIKRQLERMQQRKISTPQDDNLGVCEKCLCPLKLKVQTPLKFIKAHLAGEMLDELRAVPNCWIPAEIAAEPSA